MDPRQASRGWMRGYEAQHSEHHKISGWSTDAVTFQKFEITRDRDTSDDALAG